MTHTLRLPGFVPATVNQLLRSVRGRIRLKKGDRQVVAFHARAQGIPAASGRRRVSLAVTLAPGARRPDPDALYKSTLDALVACGLLRNDSARWCELGGVSVRHGERGTVITLEDLEG